MQIRLNPRAEFKDHQSGVKDIKVHRDGKLFFARSDDMLVLYDLKENRKVRGFYDSAGYEAATFDAVNPLMIYMSDEKLHYWDLALWRETMVLPGELHEFRDRDAHAGVGLSADGTNEGNIELRRIDAEPSDPPQAVLEGHTNYIEYVQFHPAGKILASGSADMTLRFWDLEARKEISVHRVHDDFVTAIAFSPNGSVLVTGDYSGKLKVWDLTIND